MAQEPGIGAPRRFHARGVYLIYGGNQRPDSFDIVSDFEFWRRDDSTIQNLLIKHAGCYLLRKAIR